MPSEAMTLGSDSPTFTKHQAVCDVPLLADATVAIGDWVSADRSSRGDAHHVCNASLDDARLAVRVAGALILRLGAGRQR